MKAVMVVELPAKLGILSKLLLIRMKLNLAKKAKPAPRMKCQSRRSFITLIGVMVSPVMNDLDPVRRIEITVTTEKTIV